MLATEKKVLNVEDIITVMCKDKVRQLRFTFQVNVRRFCDTAYQRTTNSGG